MKNRIQIDGVWYAREDQVEVKHTEIPEMEGGESYSILREDDKYSFEFCIDLEGKYPFFIIKYKNSTKDDGVWDSEEWLKELHANKQSVVSNLIGEDFSVGHIRVLQQMLQLAIDKGWWRLKQ